MNSITYETSVESEMHGSRRKDTVVAAGKIADNPRVFERVPQSILKRYQTCIDEVADILSSYCKVWFL